MYCNKCGRQFDGESVVCPECRAEEERKKAENEARISTEQMFYAAMGQRLGYPHVSVTDPTDNSRSYGLVFGILALVLSQLGFFFIYLPSGMNVFFMFSAFSSSIAFGIVSIVKFKRMRRVGRPAPIATLVMGIIGLAFSALLLFMFSLAFIAALNAYIYGDI